MVDYATFTNVVWCNMRLRKRRYRAVLLALRQLDRTGKIIRFISAFLALSFLAVASPIVTSTLDASLDIGSLAGVTFPVSFSYDAGQVQPVGDSFISLISFDFVLLGVPFNRSEILQGGQGFFATGASRMSPRHTRCSCPRCRLSRT